MILLALDTSGDTLSLALYRGRKRLAHLESEAARRHSEALFPLIQKLLKSAGLTPKKIEGVAVGLGPGSFTGLRVGVTAAKVLSYALGAKLIGVSSLEAMARSAKRDGTFAVMVDARRSRVYSAVYRRKNKKWSVTRKPEIYPREAFVNSLEPGTVILATVRATASAVAEAAFELADQDRYDDPRLLEPIYLSPKDCNVDKK